MHQDLPSRLRLVAAGATCVASTPTTPVGRAPFDPPQVLHHVMFEMRSCDDVDVAFDRVWDSPLDIPNELGRHDNDGMFGFYLASPAGFQVIGWSWSAHDHRRLGHRPPL